MLKNSNETTSSDQRIKKQNDWNATCAAQAKHITRDTAKTHTSRGMPRTCKSIHANKPEVQTDRNVLEAPNTEQIR
jgi:hypothetical protein